MSRMRGDLSPALSKFLCGSQMELTGSRALQVGDCVGCPSQVCSPCKFCCGISEALSKKNPLSVCPRWAGPYSHNISLALCQHLIGFSCFINDSLQLFPVDALSSFSFLKVFAFFSQRYTYTYFKKPNVGT